MLQRSQFTGRMLLGHRTHRNGSVMMNHQGEQQRNHGERVEIHGLSQERDIRFKLRLTRFCKEQ